MVSRVVAEGKISFALKLFGSTAGEGTPVALQAPTRLANTKDVNTEKFFMSGLDRQYDSEILRASLLLYAGLRNVIASLGFRVAIWSWVVA